MDSTVAFGCCLTLLPVVSFVGVYGQDIQLPTKSNQKEMFKLPGTPKPIKGKDVRDDYHEHFTQGNLTSKYCKKYPSRKKLVLSWLQPFFYPLPTYIFSPFRACCANELPRDIAGMGRNLKQVIKADCCLQPGSLCTQQVKNYPPCCGKDHGEGKQYQCVAKNKALPHRHTCVES
jgi:hypothetical protein